MNNSTKIGITAVMTIILAASTAGISNGANPEELSTTEQTITQVTDESAQQVAQKAAEKPVFEEVPDFKPAPEEKVEVKPAKTEPKAEPKPEPKVEPKAESKPEPKVEQKAEPKAEPKPSFVVTPTSGVGHTKLNAQMVRKEPHGNSPQISTVYYGKDYSITGTSGSWYQINVGGTTGYVMAGNFQVGNAPKAAPAQKSAPQPVQKAAPQAAPKQTAPRQQTQTAPTNEHGSNRHGIVRAALNAAGCPDLTIANGPANSVYMAYDWGKGVIVGGSMANSRLKWAATHECMHHKQFLEHGWWTPSTALGRQRECDADRMAARVLGYNQGFYCPN